MMLKHKSCFYSLIVVLLFGAVDLYGQCVGGSITPQARGCTNSTTSYSMYIYNGSPSGACGSISSVSGAGNSRTATTVTWGSTPGTYTVTFNCPCGTYSQQVIVTAPSTYYYMTGGGESCSSSSVNVGINSSTLNIPYTLYRNGAMMSTQMGTGSALNWSQNTAGTYTVKSSVGLGCERTMSGSVNITVAYPPAPIAVYGGGACNGAGTNIVLPYAVENGVSYQLKKDGVNYRSPQIGGTGGSIYWYNVYDAGVYTIEATRPSCGSPVMMQNSVTVSVPSITDLTLVGGGNYCVGNPGPTVKIYGPQTGVSYQLRIDGVNSEAPQVGAGSSSLDWTNQTAPGNYTIMATAPTGCMKKLTTSVNVAVIAGPDMKTLSGGGGYCIGAPAQSVSLASSQSGVNYQLRLNGTNTGSVVAGNGSTLTWPNLTATGTYTVMATLVSSNCSVLMSGAPQVTAANPPVPITNVSGLNENFSGEGNLLEVVGSADATTFTWSSAPGTVTFTDAAGSVPGKKVSVTPSVAGDYMLTVIPSKDGCQGSPYTFAYKALSRTLMDENVKKFTWNYTQLNTLPLTNYLFLPLHSSNYSGCAEEFVELTINAQLDLGENYDLGENAFSATASLDITAYSDMPGLTQTWTVPLQINQEGPEQLFIKRITVNPALVKFIKVVVNSRNAPLIAAQNAFRLQVWYDEQYTVDVTGVTLTASNFEPNNALGSRTWEQTFNWSSNCAEIPNYLFQLTQVYNGAAPDWKNALNIETENGATTLKLTLSEGTGDYVWRVRPVGSLPGGIANPLNLGAPSNEDGFHFDHPEEDKNWIYSRIFSEGNRTYEQVVYANGLQQVAQQQSREPDEAQILAKQTYQDYVGRTGITTLPIPAQGVNALGYIPNLMKNSVTGTSYKTTDFDDNPKNPAPATDFMGYYSEGSTNTINQGVPNAQGYPFLQSVYTPDGTNRIREQSGVGYTHSIKGGKTVRKFYSQPTEFELLRLFGKETPDIKSVQKITTYDANNTATVSYETKDGMVIATALAITSVTGPLSDLTSKASGTATFVDEVKGGQRIDERTIVSRKPLFFEQDRTITVDYEITAAKLQELCASSTANDLAAYYPFNGSGEDLSLANNTAEPLGATTVVAGSSGSAYRLDGNTGSYIQIADVPATDFGTSDFTVSFWVRKNANTSAWDNSAGVGKWNTGASPGTNEWSVSLASTASNNIPSFAIESGNTSYSVNGTTNMSLNQWYHITAKRQGTFLRIYVNGALQNSLTIPAGASVNNLGTSLWVGRIGTYYTAADFDELKIYRRALSDTEITELFTQGTICKTCDYKIDILLYKEGDNTPVSLGSGTVAAGECATQPFVDWSPANTNLTGGTSYTLEKRITIGNTNSATSKLFIDEHAAALDSYYRTQSGLRLAPIYAYLDANNTAGLYTYLQTQGYQFDTENQHYVVPLLPTGAGGCPEFLFIPYLQPCPPEDGAPDGTCKVNGLTFEGYFENYYSEEIAAGEIAATLPDGKLAYVFFKDVSSVTPVNLYFANDKFDQMVMNMITDNQLSCVTVWNAWKDAVKAYKVKIGATLEGTEDEASYPFATVENNLFADFLSILESKLQETILTDHELPPDAYVDVCLSRPSTTNPYFIKKDILYGFIQGGAVSLATVSSDLTNAHRLVFYNENIADQLNAVRFFANITSSTVFPTLAQFNSLSVCDKYKIYSQTKMGNLSLNPDPDQLIAEKIAKTRSECGEACESRADEFRQAIIQELFTQVPATIIEKYTVIVDPNFDADPVMANVQAKYLGIYDATVNTTGFTVSLCELDKMVNALVQNCKDNYCNITLTPQDLQYPGKPSNYKVRVYGTALEWEKLKKPVTHKFALQVKSSSGSCDAGWDYLNSAAISAGPQAPTGSIAQGWQYGGVLGAPSNPANFNQTFTVTNSNASGVGSFTQALIDAKTYNNSNPTHTKLIRFNIGAGGNQQVMIAPLTLVSIANLTIDGTTQPGYNILNGPPITVVSNSTSSLIDIEFGGFGGNYKLIGLGFKNQGTTYGFNLHIVNSRVEVYACMVIGLLVHMNVTDPVGSIFQGNLFSLDHQLNPVPPFFGNPSIRLYNVPNALVGGPQLQQANVGGQGTFFQLSGLVNNALIQNNRVLRSNGPVFSIQGSNNNNSKFLNNLHQRGSGSFSSGFSVLGGSSGTNATKPAPVIASVELQLGASKISGTAQPYDNIQIFLSEPHVGNPTSYNVIKMLGNVQANALGQWSLAGLPVPYGYEVIATATDANTTSIYSNRLVVTAPVCTVARTMCFQFTVPIAPITIPGNADVFNPVQEPCVNTVANAVRTSLDQQKEQLIASKVAGYKSQYYAQCGDPSQILDKLTVQYATGLHHFTLYYYDRAGNLIRTVPPKGVVLMPLNNATQINAARTTFPAHAFVSEYQYNSLGQLIREHTPDGTPKPNVSQRPLSTATPAQIDADTYYTSNYYNSSGQVRYTQNPQQKLDNKFSYTKYDNLFRIVELGESADFNSVVAGIERDGTGRDSYPMTGVQVTSTHYDKPTGTPPAGYTQTYLQNRASYSVLDEDGNPATLNDRVTTTYSYDPHGNVNWLGQSIPGMPVTVITYDYDLISGKVTQMNYAPGRQDQLFHKYVYDATNRLKSVLTSRDKTLWERDVRYSYYAHGPLKRTELGEDRLQGIDYTYTTEGWIKAINHPVLDASTEPSQDGYTNLSNISSVGRDAFGMALTYYSGDYTRTASPFQSSHGSALAPMTGRDLYNGNISSWTVNGTYAGSYNTEFANATIANRNNPTGYVYRYDELDRLVEGQYRTFNGTSWQTSTDYSSTHSYDANGNLLTGIVRASGSSAALDNLIYNYNAGTNRLNYVGDNAQNTPATPVDIENQSANNYLYDAVGNLIADVKDGTTIEWTPYGKVLQVGKAGLTTKFGYDALGNRVIKKRTFGGGIVKTNFYIRDTRGHILGVYERIDQGSATGEVVLNELPIYGIERHGTFVKAITVGVAGTALEPSEVRVVSSTPKASYEGFNYLVNQGATLTLNQGFIFTSQTVEGTTTAFSVRVDGASSTTQGDTYTRTFNNRQYELKDHLGNVRSVVGDVKLSVISGSNLPGNFEAKILAVNNYYPFGMDQPGRMWNSSKYRYGFNGKEKDDNGEWGSNSAYDYGFRIYNPAIGRFLSVDPLMKSYAMLTPFQFAANSPIQSIDVDGLEQTEIPLPDGRTAVIDRSSAKEISEFISMQQDALAKAGAPRTIQEFKPDVVASDPSNFSEFYANAVYTRQLYHDIAREKNKDRPQIQPKTKVKSESIQDKIIKGTATPDEITQYQVDAVADKLDRFAPDVIGLQVGGTHTAGGGGSKSTIFAYFPKTREWGIYETWGVDGGWDVCGVSASGFATFRNFKTRPKQFLSPRDFGGASVHYNVGVWYFTGGVSESWDTKTMTLSGESRTISFGLQRPGGSLTVGIDYTYPLLTSDDF